MRLIRDSPDAPELARSIVIFRLLLEAAV